MEAWLKGVSMVGLPRNLILVPDAGKPSSKTREHTHQDQSRAAHGPKDSQIQNRTRTATDPNRWEDLLLLFKQHKQSKYMLS